MLIGLGTFLPLLFGATTIAVDEKSDYVTLLICHCGQYDTMCATIGWVSRKAFADDIILGDEREPVSRRLHLPIHYISRTILPSERVK